MAQCEKLVTCPFFQDKMTRMPNSAAMMKEIFCLGDMTRCARYLVSEGGMPTPPDLYPSDSEWARQIISTRE